MAKAPVAGRVKTRLCPPLSPEQAARLAEASLADTLEAVARCGADRRILALEGEPGPWLPPGFTVIRQTEGPFDRRLAGAWAEAGGPGIQIGMDTPQVTASLLDDGLATLAQPEVDAVLGLAVDGGWWVIGLPEGAQPDVFLGVPMSTPTTGQAQRERLAELGHRVAMLPVLRDVDEIGDAEIVARTIPRSRFAAVHGRFAMAF